MTGISKVITFFLFLFICSLTVLAQKDLFGDIPREIPEEVDTPAAFPGGGQAMIKYLYKNISYPSESYRKKVEGKVEVRFVVEIDGSISKIEFLKHLDQYCDEEVIRVINKMPRWNPARKDGAAIASYYKLPVLFKVD